MSKHKIISLVKSGIRLIGCGCGAYAMYPLIHQYKGDLLVFHAFVFLFLAEVLGIIEEEFENK